VTQRIHYKDMTSIMPSVPNWLRIGTGRGIFMIRVKSIGVCSVARNLVAISVFTNFLKQMYSELVLLQNRLFKFVSSTAYIEGGNNEAPASHQSGPYKFMKNITFRYLHAHKAKCARRFGRFRNKGGL